MASKPNKLELEQAKQDSARAWFERRKAEAKTAAPEIPIIDRISEYKDFFVRDEALYVKKTKSSSRSKQTLELVRHVLQKYPVPSFMNYIWEDEVKTNEHAKNGKIVKVKLSGKWPEYEMWYVCIATGGSLHKEYFKDKGFTKKETHTFLNCRFDLTIPQALVFAVAKASGGKDGNALRVARSKLVIYPFNEFWKHVIRFFAQEDELTVNQIDDLIDYLQHKRTEPPAGEIGIRHESLSTFTIAGMGYTVESLTKKMKDWHYDLRRIKAIGNETWDGISVPDQTYVRTSQKGKKSNWFFKQIRTAKELQQEGNAQRHCVYSYKQRCISGDISIWSLSNEDEFGGIHRKLTIELTKDQRIVQARGLAQRAPREDEQHLMRVWAADHHFSMSINSW